MKKKKIDVGLVMTGMSEQKMDMGGSAGSCMAAAFLAAGMVGLFLPAFPSVEWNALLTGTAVVVLCLGILLAARISKGRQEVILVAFALYAVLCFGQIRDGMRCLGNDMLTFWTGQTGRIHLLFDVQNEKNVGFAVCSIGFLLVFLTAEAVWYGWLWPELLLTILIMAGLSCGFLQAGIGAVLFFIGLIGLLVLRGQEQSAAWQWKNLPVYIGLFVSAGLVLACAAGVSGNAAGSAYERWKASMHAAAYDTDTSSMPEGKLSNLSGWNKSGAAALALTGDHWEKLYLRGMTGETYTGQSWEPLSAEKRAASTNLFYWLHKQDFYGQAVLQKAAEAVEETGSSYTLEIENLGACKGQLYLPYALETTELLDADLIGDGQTPAGEKTWTFSYRSGSVPAWYGILQQLSEKQEEAVPEQYLKLEESYREYVYAQDLELTEAAGKTLDRLLPKQEGTLPLSKIKEQIYQCLEEHLAYDEEAVTQNGAQDFLSYTLEQKKSGYSVHYATAATLMLRYYGVPARYVEGYLLTKEMASRASTEEPLVLDETCAHAWAEYYLDGVGWIPFETTPGYIDPEEIGVDENSEQGQNYNGQSKSYLQQEIQEQTQIAEESSRFLPALPYVLFGLFLLLLITAVLIALYSRKKVVQHLEEMRMLPPKEAIPAWYGYAVCLRRHQADGQEDAAMWEQMHRINEEALFSGHEMTEEQKETLLQFAETVKADCIRTWSRWDRFRYRWIRCIY